VAAVERVPLSAFKVNKQAGGKRVEKEFVGVVADVQLHAYALHAGADGRAYTEV